MGRRKYPRIQSTAPYRPGQLRQRDKPCVCCGEPACASVVIEWSYMRGDDEREDVCGKHWLEANRDEEAFFRSLNVKVTEAGS